MIKKYSKFLEDINSSNTDANVEKAKKLISTDQRDLKTFLQEFGELAKDKKVQSFLKSAGSDDSFTFKSAHVQANKLFPSQNQIGVDKSLNDIIKETYNLEKQSKELSALLKGDKVEMGVKGGTAPICCAYAPPKDGQDEKFWVIDGHHRWSKAFMANPNAVLSCVVFDAKEDIDIIQVLKAFHLVNFAHQETGYLSPTKPLEGENLMEVNKELVRKHILENLDDKISKVWIDNVTTINTKEEIDDHIMKAVGDIQKMKTEGPDKIGSDTSRTNMPQTGTVGVDKIANDLQNSKINVVESFNTFTSKK